ncbi:MAG: 16S rRNA (adenine(1518)-N(6)/adenine(1519)-N(6))-dimethyltransferase RsmA [Nitrosopumilus sp.]
MPFLTRRKALGQHELVDLDVLQIILMAAAITKRDTVFEAGAGRGELTEKLSKTAGRVVAYELDKRLFLALKARFDQYDNIKIINGDAFISNDKFDIFVSNLPYSQSRRFIEWLVTKKFKRAVVTFQREFADKLNAAPSSRNYKSVSVLARSRFQLDVIAQVDKRAFRPIPKVDATVLSIIPHDDNVVMPETVKALNLLFSYRRKRLSRVLSTFSPKLIDYSELREERVASLKPEILFRIAMEISK